MTERVIQSKTREEERTVEDTHRKTGHNASTGTDLLDCLIPGHNFNLAVQ